MAPSDQMHLRVFLDEGYFEDDLADRIEGRIMSGPKLYLYIYGKIVYESMGIRGVNSFCYLWDNRMGFALEGDKTIFVKDGPDGYNEHT